MSIRAATHLAAAAVAAALAWQFQGARLGAELAEARLETTTERLATSTAQRAADARVRQAEQAVATTYQGALNDALKKQTALQAAAAGAGRERDSLRKQLSAAEQRLADASPGALIEYASTLNDLFGQCSSRYTELAAAADGHAADAATCRAAWPVIQTPRLPAKLQAVSKPVGLLAELLEKQLPDGPEKSAGMRKLLEAKDCFVRVALDMPEPPASKLAPHQQRVLDEKMERDQEITRLDTFIRENAAFPTLPDDEQARLRRQLDVMHELSTILGERIANF